jgi:N-acetyl-beta-hexosaminidase
VAGFDDAGAGYGLTTLAQLLRYDTDLHSHVLDYVPLQISDTPRFEWRGYMIDSCGARFQTVVFCTRGCHWISRTFV